MLPRAPAAGTRSRHPAATVGGVTRQDDAPEAGRPATGPSCGPCWRRRRQLKRRAPAARPRADRRQPAPGRPDEPAARRGRGRRTPQPPGPRHSASANRPIADDQRRRSAGADGVADQPAEAGQAGRTTAAARRARQRATRYHGVRSSISGPSYHRRPRARRRRGRARRPASRCAPASTATTRRASAEPGPAPRSRTTGAEQHERCSLAVRDSHGDCGAATAGPAARAGGCGAGQGRPSGRWVGGGASRPRWRTHPGPGWVHAGRRRCGGRCGRGSGGRSRVGGARGRQRRDRRRPRACGEPGRRGVGVGRAARGGERPGKSSRLRCGRCRQRARAQPGPDRGQRRPVGRLGLRPSATTGRRSSGSAGQVVLAAADPIHDRHRRAGAEGWPTRAAKATVAAQACTSEAVVASSP